MTSKYNYLAKPRIYYQNLDTLDRLREYVSQKLEHPLKATAKNTVFSNNGTSDIMIIGEAPGADEDEQGQPFVGRSGQLLMKIFESIGLTREKLYITNLVPWRPPLNRNPTFEEMDFFLPIMKKHIRCKDPKVIVLLGGIITKALISKDIVISKVRGTFIDLEIEGKTYKVLPSFHPSYLLRSPMMKKLAWEDMCTLKKEII
ncbi:MAG: uracil-DNA glycosylase [Alphaproteobacteria bacterium]|nr:MAG: uracil-DNA glycosylase [Alphaproteobacteria bacterium]